MKEKDRLDKAIEFFEDENSTIPFSERFSELGKAFMWNAFEKIKRIKKKGLKDPISDEDNYVQEEGMKQFRIMERVYESELKRAKDTGKTEADVDTDYLKRVLEMKSTVGDIVRDTK